MDKYKDELTEIAQNTLLNDSTHGSNDRSELQAANVKMKTPTWQTCSFDYITAARNRRFNC